MPRAPRRLTAGSGSHAPPSSRASTRVSPASEPPAGDRRSGRLKPGPPAARRSTTSTEPSSGFSAAALASGWIRKPPYEEAWALGVRVSGRRLEPAPIPSAAGVVATTMEAGWWETTLPHVAPSVAG